MASENPSYIKEEADQSPPLLDKFLEEVGVIKLEIHKVKNRVRFLKGFYEHIRNTCALQVRKELEDKVNVETEAISNSLLKITDALQKWNGLIEASAGVQKLQRRDMEKGVRNYLKEVLSEYEEVMKQHRDLCLKELHTMLKVSTVKDSAVEKGNILMANQAHIDSLTAEKHIEIEERYCELLRTDKNLRYLKNKYSPYLLSGEYTDLAVLHLSKFLDSHSRYPTSKGLSKRNLVLILASVSTLSLFLIVMAFFI